MNGSIYERELAGILSGSPKVLEKLAKKVDAPSKAAVETLLERPFYVTRAAGSLGADIIAIRHDYSMVIEVKSSINSTITFTEASGMRQEQAERLQEKCLKSGLFIIYAFRLKNAPGDPWRMFSLPGDPKGRMRFLYNILSDIGLSRNGNYVLKWGDGTPLSKLVDYLNQTI
ncbi:hypothetical protein IX51_04265 [uncultured archaeon]|nr:hypothetical protein IX51_04265 [uncultured archaeon]HKJ97163.1 hypothetical protein [Thermoplasmataceae archaeon]